MNNILATLIITAGAAGGFLLGMPGESGAEPVNGAMSCEPGYERTNRYCDSDSDDAHIFAYGLTAADCDGECTCRGSENGGSQKIDCFEQEDGDGSGSGSGESDGDPVVCWECTGTKPLRLIDANPPKPPASDPAPAPAPGPTRGRRPAGG